MEFPVDQTRYSTKNKYLVITMLGKYGYHKEYKTIEEVQRCWNKFTKVKSEPPKTLREAMYRALSEWKKCMTIVVAGDTMQCPITQRVFYNSVTNSIELLYQ